LHPPERPRPPADLAYLAAARCGVSEVMVTCATAPWVGGVRHGGGAWRMGGTPTVSDSSGAFTLNLSRPGNMSATLECAIMH
jgi:hypothetical protein